jgi:hypothetical protein
LEKSDFFQGFINPIFWKNRIFFDNYQTKVWTPSIAKLKTLRQFLLLFINPISWRNRISFKVLEILFFGKIGFLSALEIAYVLSISYSIFILKLLIFQ